MKNVKELKKQVMPRLMCCWGENCAIFFLTLGGLASAFLSWILTVDFLSAINVIEASERRINMSDGIVHIVTATIVLILWLIGTPYTYGVKWYRIQQVRGNSVHARSIFSCYGSVKRIGQLLKLNAALLLKKSVFLIPFFAVIATGMWALTYVEIHSGKSMAYSAAAVLLILLSVCIIFVICMLNMKYVAVPFLFALEPDKPASYLIEKSGKIVSGRVSYIIETLLSLAKWLMPCVAIFPSIFIFPYMRMVYTAAINELITTYEQDDEAIEILKRREQLASES